MTESIASLPDSVTRLEVDGREVFLVGTAHVSKKSVDDVRETIEAVDPDTVCIELCAPRFENLRNRDAWRKLDIFKVLREGKAMLLLSSLLMTSFQRRIAQELGVEPGAEMTEAARLAEERGCELVLADRDVQITFRRTWASLGWWTRLKLLPRLVAGLLLPEEIDEETIERLKDGDELGDMLAEMAEALPEVKGSLIDERDVYLAEKIRQAPGQRVVAVVGAAHVPGIVRVAQAGTTTDLAPLETIPARAWWPKVLQWAIPVAIVGLIVYGFVVGGAERSLESVAVWVLVNGILAAIGTAIALGHPVTVLSAFVAAPLTSLNPMIAAGWVAGLVQAWVRRPTVEDLENLPDQIVTVKGWWSNPVSRILLVVVFANLGSTVGTVVAGGWIAARVL